MNRRFAVPELKLQNKTRHNKTIDTEELESRKQTLIKIANNSWGANLWSYSLTNQVLDFVDEQNGGFVAGCASIVRVQLSNGIFREDMGYATMEASQKGLAIFQARKCSVTNALSEIFHGFGLDVQDANFSESSTITIPDLQQTHRVNRERSPTVARSSKIIKTNINKDIASPPSSQLDNAILEIPEDITEDRTNQKENVKPEPLAPKLPTRSDSTVKEPPKLAVSSGSTAKNTNTNVSTLDYQKNTSSKLENSVNATSGQAVFKDPKTITEAEMRAERLRRQKEKQEEFRRQILQNAARK